MARSDTQKAREDIEKASRKASREASDTAKNISRSAKRSTKKASESAAESARRAKEKATGAMERARKSASDLQKDARAKDSSVTREIGERLGKAFHTGERDILGKGKETFTSAITQAVNEFKEGFDSGRQKEKPSDRGPKRPAMDKSRKK